MGSTGVGAILFYCVALSTIAVGSAAPADNNGRFISKEALACSNITETSHRKLEGLPSGLCPVQFERMPGIKTVVNSCRPPQPSEQRCCGAFKAFACPYFDLINDNANNGCASQMFYDIIVRGRLSPGLFSYLCHDGAVGLNCGPAPA
ncbi:hypothetical protein EJB05_38868 [Eragrostis curvula]|uniref:GPI-anchored protein LLG1-like domain-containing protein n=1 Tax=Eragrostis curvula TaxID=38414 RepID=A0A5J9TVA9_9POAL|nr:hypothetical protein EJB05_38868 [Eragrostis curvula]